MGKIMIAGAIHDADEFERTMAELDAANGVTAEEQPSPFSPDGAKAIMDAYNAKATAHAKSKRRRK